MFFHDKNNVKPSGWQYGNYSRKYVLYRSRTLIFFLLLLKHKGFFSMFFRDKKQCKTMWLAKR